MSSIASEYNHIVQDFIKYKRILVLGSPGAGKTTFTKKLGEIIKLPIKHLDDYYWQSNWQRLDVNKWKEVLNNLCQQKQWILDGNHFKTLEDRLQYTDLIIWLDYPTHLCAWRFLYRSIKRLLKYDDNLPSQIKSDVSYRPKITIQWHIIKLILFFKLTTKPGILSLINKYQRPCITLKSKKHAGIFLNLLRN